MENELLDYLLSLLPAITAILTALATMITIFVKIRQLTETSHKETNKLKNDISAILAENVEVKKELRRVLNKVYRVREDEQESKSNKSH